MSYKKITTQCIDDLIGDLSLLDLYKKTSDSNQKLIEGILYTTYQDYIDSQIAEYEESSTASSADWALGITSYPDKE